MRKIFDFCTLDYCNNKHRARGYCEKHYQQWRLKGKPYKTVRDQRIAIIENNSAKLPVGFNAKFGYTTIDLEDLALIPSNLYLCKDYVAYWEDGKNKKLHRLLLGVKDKSIQVDHINHNKFDNRKSNLRLCSQSQNKRNSRPYKNSNFGFKGITRNKSGNWVAQLRSGGRTYHLGIFSKPEDAARAYDKKAIQLYGDYAYLNFRAV